MAKFADDRASLAGPEQTRDDSRGDGADVRIPVGLRGPRETVGARARTVGRRQLYTTLSKLPMLYFPAHDVSLNHAQGRDTAPGPNLRLGHIPKTDLYMCVVALIAACSSPIVALHRQIELEGASAIASGNLDKAGGERGYATVFDEARQRADESSAQSQT